MLAEQMLVHSLLSMANNAFICSKLRKKNCNSLALFFLLRKQQRRMFLRFVWKLQSLFWSAFIGVIRVLKYFRLGKYSWSKLFWTVLKHVHVPVAFPKSFIERICLLAVANPVKLAIPEVLTVAFYEPPTIQGLQRCSLLMRKKMLVFRFRS